MYPPVHTCTPVPTYLYLKPVHTSILTNSSEPTCSCLHTCARLTTHTHLPSTPRIYSREMIRAGHVMCGSNVSFQTVHGHDTAPPLTAMTHPDWLGVPFGVDAQVCYMDATEAFYPGALGPFLK